jgi:hypothetical protein
MNNVDFSNSGSWNSYAYANGDPTNSNDPDGLQTCGSLILSPFDQSLSDLMSSGSNAALIANVVWAESSADYLDLGSTYYTQKEDIGWAILNRYYILHGEYTLTAPNGAVLNPATLQFVPRSVAALATIAQVIGYGGFASTIGGGNPNLNPAFQSKLNSILDADIDDPAYGPTISVQNTSTGGVVYMDEECFNVLESWVTGYMAMADTLPDPFASQGLVTSFNTTGNSAGPYLQSFGSVGGTYFFGFSSSHVHPPGWKPPKPTKPPKPPRRPVGRP